MDENLKRQAEMLFEDMGINMTTAFTIFVKTVVRQGKIPFEIAGDPFCSAANQERLRDAIK
jgi:DNA-damage-inducible protein J